MSSLNITSRKQLLDLLDRAKHLKAQTPASFWEIPQMETIFGENAGQTFRRMSKEQKMQLQQGLDQMMCLPITPQDILK